MLRDTQIAGHPGSHFHKPSLEGWLKSYNLNGAHFKTRLDAVKAVIAAGIACGKGGSSMFGLRLQRHSFDFFIDQLKKMHPDLPNDTARFEATFGKTLFIHLTRQNKLDQTVSYIKAQQTGLWHRASDGTEIERLSAPKEPIYNAGAIREQLAMFEDMDAAWRDWFAQEGIRPLHVTYDDLSARPHDTLARVMITLGLDYAPIDTGELPVAKLADATNQAWVNRFLSESNT